MRIFYYIIWSIIQCHSLMAADASINFKDQVLVLEQLVPPSKAKNKVLADLKSWDPEVSSSLWQLPMWFWDRYLNDDSFSGEIRASFLSSLVNSVAGEPLAFSTETLIRASEVGLETLRFSDKIPYMLYAEGVSPSHEMAKTFTVIFCHMSALGSQACQAMLNTSNDPFNMLALYLGSRGFAWTSILSAIATGCLFTDDDYIDVALRSLKRSYEKLHQEAKLAVVVEMIAERAKLRAEANGT